MRNRIIFGASLFIILGVLVGICFYLLLVPRVSIARVRLDIESNVPVGTTKEDAKEWLRSQSYIYYNGEIADKQTGRVQGIAAHIRNSGPRWDASERIEIVVYLENDRVIGVHVERLSPPLF
jgi:hypothetical protein